MEPRYPGQPSPPIRPLEIQSPDRGVLFVPVPPKKALPKKPEAAAPEPVPTQDPIYRVDRSFTLTRVDSPPRASEPELRDALWLGAQAIGGNSRIWNVGGSLEGGYCFRVGKLHCAELGAGYQYTGGFGKERAPLALKYLKYEDVGFDHTHGPYLHLGYNLGFHPSFSFGVFTHVGLAFMNEGYTAAIVRPGISRSVEEKEDEKTGLYWQLGLRGLLKLYGPLWAHAGFGVKSVPGIRQEEPRNFGLGMQAGLRLMF